MMKAFWIVVVLLVLAADWAALHDIVTGGEPDYRQEWTWLVASTLVLAGLAWIAFRRRRGRRSEGE